MIVLVLIIGEHVCQTPNNLTTPTNQFYPVQTKIIHDLFNHRCN